ncbi:MAG: transcriptional regulator [Candidatus Bathyarchaeia archaeon]
MSHDRRCSLCNVLIEDEVCQFAAYKKIVNGKEYVFCCQSCASKFEE